MRKDVNFGCCYHAVEIVDFRNSQSEIFILTGVIFSITGGREPQNYQ